MKTIKFVLGALLFSMALPSSFAHASSFFAQFYTVGSSGSTTEQTTFSYSQLPYLYVEFYNAPPAGSLDNRMTFTGWQNESDFNMYPNVNISDTNQTWVSFSQNYWDSIKSPGTWSITALSFNTSPILPLIGQTSFKVNAAPEPVGTVLFLTGALVMGISILRRKRAMAV